MPLEVWLRTAEHLTAVRQDISMRFRNWADQVVQTAHNHLDGTEIDPSVRSALAQIEDAHKDERVLFRNDLLRYDFLLNGFRAGSSVAHLSVPRHEGGEPRLDRHSGKHMTYFGTGWLIGPQHIVTNHHVIRARSRGEAHPDQRDFRIQAERTIVKFDFNERADPGERFEGLTLRAESEALDYAVLELPTKAAERTPLSLLGVELSLPGDGRLAVNIIQHPDGAAKQICIRNNLAIRLTERDLAYLTDTDYGSSGSPVCNDDWIVLALHRGSTNTFGKVDYQGSRTAWVNVGTRIDRLINDLTTAHPQLWDAIRANVVYDQQLLL